MDENGFGFRYAELPPPVDPELARKRFSRLSFALLAFLASATILQIVYTLLMRLPGFPSQSWFFWIFGYIVPLYLVGVPAALLIMRRVPALPAERRKLRVGELLSYLLMCFPIMYAGSIVGTILSYMFSSGAAENPLAGITAESSLLQIVVMTVLAPLFEEFIFRKQLIDRCSRYGEKTALVFSSLCFGLFHGNLYQFFYAFGLGLLFAWIYTRTRRLRYTVILHMIVNFLGSVVAPWIVSRADLTPETLEAMAQDPAAADLGSMALVSLYSILLIGLSIAGLVLLISRRRRFVLLPAQEELPKGKGLRTACVNPGFILFALVCLGVFVFALFGA